MDASGAGLSGQAVPVTKAVGTEARHPAAAGLQARPAEDVLALLLQAQVAALSALAPVLPGIGRLADHAATRLAAGGRVAYAGAGSSGLMALADCLELAGTFGLAPEQVPMLFAGGAAALLHMTGAVEDDAASAVAEVQRAGLGPGDLVVVLSASGTTPYALAVAEAARAAGALVAGFANVPGSRLLLIADLPVLLDTGPELVAGSTRLGAATAQKAALNLFSVQLGIRLGHVHDGYMVNLVADNAKLRSRATGIVAALAGVSPAQAASALAATQGAVKPAVLVARGMSPAAARAALQASGGHLAGLLD